MTDTLGSRAGAGHQFDELRAAVQQQRSTFEGAARRAERERTLPADIVEVMRGLDLFWLKSPLEVGGSELNPLEFSEILEEIAYSDASAGWAAMIGNGVTGTVAGWLPDPGVAEVFPAGGPLPILAGQFVPRGSAISTADGYLVSGRWEFCSGIHHASWVVGGCQVDNVPGDKLLVVVPKSQATVHDTWHVAGLQGTGSGGFSLDRTFVPATRVCRFFNSPALRGGQLFAQPSLLFLSNELGPVAVGIARRAVDDMYELAAATVRGLDDTALSARATFQKDIGRAHSRLRAAQLLYRDAVGRSWHAAGSNAQFTDSFVTELRAQHTLVVEECLDLVSTIFHYGGGRALGLDSPMQRHLRNLTAVRQHLYVSDESYEVAARARIAELAGVEDLGPSTPTT